jgi:hypothetical protein
MTGQNSQESDMRLCTIGEDFSNNSAFISVAGCDILNPRRERRDDRDLSRRSFS